MATLNDLFGKRGKQVWPAQVPAQQGAPTGWKAKPTQQQSWTQPQYQTFQRLEPGGGHGGGVEHRSPTSSPTAPTPEHSQPSPPPAPPPPAPTVAPPVQSEAPVTGIDFSIDNFYNWEKDVDAKYGSGAWNDYTRWDLEDLQAYYAIAFAGQGPTGLARKAYLQKKNAVEAAMATAVPRVAEDEAGQAEQDFRDMMQPYIDDLNEKVGELEAVQPPDYTGIDQGIEGVLSRVRDIDLDSAHAAAAIGMGFIQRDAAGNYMKDANGDYIADTDAYFNYINQGVTARTGDMPGLGEDQMARGRKLAMSEAATMRDAATRTVESLYANQGSYMRALSAADEASRQVADFRLRAEFDLINEHAAQQFKQFEAEGQRWAQAMSQGHASANAYLTTVSSRIGAEVGILAGQFQMLRTQYTDQLDAIDRQADLILRSAALAMGVEQQALDTWDQVYDQNLKPILDQFNMDLMNRQLDLMDQELTFGWDDIMDLLGTAVSTAGKAFGGNTFGSGGGAFPGPTPENVA